VAALAVPPRREVAAQQLTAAERAAAVASVWAEARYNFAYWDRVRADRTCSSIVDCAASSPCWATDAPR